MNNKSLYKISKNLSFLFDSEDLNSIYQNIMSLSYRHSEFFRIKQLKPLDYIKISILIYSYKKTNDFSLGENMISGLYFFKIVSTDGELITKECGGCDGSGDIACDYCDGDGYNTCRDCNGRGKITCQECDGDGEITDDEGNQQTCESCDGNGDENCDECDGDGTISCNECDGNGTWTCNDCNGDGDYISDDYNYQIVDYCYWDRKILSYMVDSYELKKPISDQNIAENNTEYLTLSDYEIESSEEIGEEDMFYCAYLSYDPIITHSGYNLSLSHTNLDGYLSETQ